MSEKPSIVLVHGAWVDGSCWSAVIEPPGRQRRDGAIARGGNRADGVGEAQRRYKQRLVADNAAFGMGREAGQESGHERVAGAQAIDEFNEIPGTCAAARAAGCARDDAATTLSSR